MNLVDVIDQYGDDATCREYLEQLRWPHGVVCPRCKSNGVSRIRDRDQYDCNSCRYRFSVTAGTLFHDSHLPLRKWFLAIYIIGESKKGVSSKQLQRMLGVTYKTAWYLQHRIRDAMGEDEQPLLRGIVEMDETYIEEMEFRFNGRDNPYLFRDTLMVMLQGDALPYRQLVDRT